MPSAGRAFTWRLLFDLQRRGVETALLVLHTGLSLTLDEELDAQHPASEEEYSLANERLIITRRTHVEEGFMLSELTVVRTLESAS